MKDPTPDIIGIVKELQKTLSRAKQWVEVGGDWHFEEAQLDDEDKMTPYGVMSDEIESAEKKAEIISQALSIAVEEFQKSVTLLRQWQESAADGDDYDIIEKAKDGLEDAISKISSLPSL